MNILRSQDIVYTLGHVDPQGFLEAAGLTADPENVQYGFMVQLPGATHFFQDMTRAFFGSRRSAKKVTVIRESGRGLFG